MQVDYSYQEKAATVVLNNALNPKYIGSVLGACPGSGKTTISHIIINKYIQINKSANVLVLTEGQKVLKEQYLQELTNSNVKINFTFGEFSSEAQVRVGIPQSIDNLKWNKIDLLIVDEAHNFFFANSVQNIIKSLNPKHIILMTGSPTKFNDFNKYYNLQYAIFYIAAEDLQKNGVFNSVNMDVFRTANAQNPIESIKDAISSAKKNKDNLDKIMVACPSIDYAKKVANELNIIGFNVALSTSENDINNNEIKEFKAGNKNALIVVGKGILGFNDSNITTLFDLKSSDSLDNSYQLFARVLRKHPKNIKKTYYRISDSNNEYKKQVFILHKMLGLMKKEIFKGFDGKNLKLEITV